MKEKGWLSVGCQTKASRGQVEKQMTQCAQQESLEELGDGRVKEVKATAWQRKCSDSGELTYLQQSRGLTG